MNKIARYLIGLVGSFFVVAAFPIDAQERQNAIEAIAVVQQGGVLNVKLSFKQPLTALPPSFSVANPARIVLDFADTVNGLGKNSQSFNEAELKSVNVVQAEDRTRVVLNLNRGMLYEQTIDGKNLLLALTASSNAGEFPSRLEHFSQPSAIQSNAVNVRDISFRRGKDGEARITVELSDPNAGIDIRQQGQNLLVDFLKVGVPEVLRKKLDVTDFSTPVVSVSTVQQGVNARMTISPRGLWEHNAYQTDNLFVIEIKPVIENPNKLVQGTRGGYQGEKLSLNFQNVEVRRLLQVIGEFTGMNIVVSDSVGGAITLILKDVPWDQALDIILQQKGLDMRKNGNVILIAPREEIATKEKLEFESKAQIGDLEPLHTESFLMNYIKGADVKKLLSDSKQTLLSKRGSALLDERSNMLFVQDTPSRLDDVRAMIAKIDIPVRQVLIEARIVEAGDSFSKNLGVRLGTGALTKTTTKDSNTGEISSTYTKETELGWINSTQTTGGLGSVNLPASSISGTSAASYALTLFDGKMSRYLDIEISALEADGRGKVISNPRIMTTNQVEAIIEQGVEIPYQQATSSGATSIAYKKANLSLKVKPQITPDGKVTMSLDINKDTPNTSLSTGSGLAIDTKHVKTEVLVENGGTVVIGGIYTQEKSTSTYRVPLLGDLPYLGWLFKSTEWVDNKTELLVFITPKIVSDNLAVR
ncbi:type IV pilus secretin PilQ [Propionivibrio limicola]|uniref:type IV pilus secretin PilQ n=1 Tax=Propionivibrio limicola TaxID=167645 RepID=UPI0012922D05|nr:type IV pilus secretin PilQ [Propionivibrio limicola]